MFLSPESAWVMGPAWSTEHWGAETASGTQCTQQGGEQSGRWPAGNKYSACSMAARQLAAGKKMSSFSFSAIRLFQRKKKQNKNNLCV